LVLLCHVPIKYSAKAETELEDILSTDDTLLNDVFHFHVPPIIRIPPLLFVRLRHDIASYLVDREVDDITVFFWYHRQFMEAAHTRYLSDDKFEEQIHSALAEYFIGTWHNKTKPYTYSASQVKKLKLPSNDNNGGMRMIGGTWKWNTSFNSVSSVDKMSSNSVSLRPNSM
jgi:hypothetical protein